MFGTGGLSNTKSYNLQVYFSYLVRSRLTKILLARDTGRWHM